MVRCERGTVVCLDTDSHNHHSEQALPIGWRGLPANESEEKRATSNAMGDKWNPHPCPSLPAKASMSARPFNAALDGPPGPSTTGDADLLLDEGLQLSTNQPISDRAGDSSDEWVWEVRDDETGKVVMRIPEQDLRFSISCKIP